MEKRGIDDTINKFFRLVHIFIQMGQKVEN